MQGKIVLAVTSSGIAATLLQNGKTAHSTFKLPLNVQSQARPFCCISKQSSLKCLDKHLLLYGMNRLWQIKESLKLLIAHLDIQS